MIGHPDQRWGGRTYSQHGEDLVLLAVFEHLGIESPSYLDIGAHHPENISNTKLLYDRGSRGVNVEANPNLYQLFVEQRPEDKNVNVGVGLVNGEARFYMYDDFSGRNTFSQDEVKAYGHTVRKEVMLPILTLDTIVKRYCMGTYPAFLSVDIEGLDFDVLQNADFTDSHPVMVCVETRIKDSEKMRGMLYFKGFHFLIRMGENMIFVASEHMEKLL